MMPERKTYKWADVHLGKCCLSFHSGDSRLSPTTRASFPGWNIDVDEQDMFKQFRMLVDYIG